MKLKAKIKILPEFILAVFIIVYLTFFSYVTVKRHNNLNSSYYDLAIMDQTVYNTSKGRILELTDPEGTANFKRMAIHNDIILAILAPFYYLYQGPETLLVIQTIILALGAIPLYLLAVKVLGSRLLGLIFSFVYLMYPPLQNANLFDFHAVTLATSFLIFMIYFVNVKKYILSFIFFLLAIISKEQVALTTAMYGIYLLFTKRNFNEKSKEILFPVIIILTSIIWFTLSIWVIIPYFRQGPHFALSRYKDFGDTPAAVITGLLLKPQLFIKQLVNADNLKYLFQLLAPLAFLPLFAPIYFFVLLPELAINLLSSHWQMKTIDLHYTAVITPFIIIAAVFGSKKIISKFKSISFVKLGILILLATFVMSYFHGKKLYSQNGKINQYFKVRSEIRAVKLWEKTLKNEDIIVSVTESLGPHFSQRKVFYRFSGSYKEADYVLLLVDNIYSDWLDRKGSIKTYQDLKQDKNFELIYKKDEFEVYEKRKSS